MGAKQGWGGGDIGGDKPIFWVARDLTPVLPLGEILYMRCTRLLPVIQECFSLILNWNINVFLWFSTGISPKVKVICQRIMENCCLVQNILKNWARSSLVLLDIFLFLTQIYWWSPCSISSTSSVSRFSYK